MTITLLLWVAMGTGFIFLMTCLGSAVVFFFKNQVTNDIVLTIALGFAAGIMIAASVFGLLIPSIDEASNSGMTSWLPAAGGFILGVFFLFGLDKIIPHLHPVNNVTEGISTSLKRTSLLVSAVTLHNIPEGIAVGLSFALAAQHPENQTFLLSAMALALGIGIQNFPEGAAVSLPLRKEGMSTTKSFFLGCASGAVEPIFGFITIFFAGLIFPIMPWLLSFAAGCMLYVVVEELIPEAHLGEHSNVGTLAVMAGFVVMMVLDIAL
ncbi:MAG: ZIP family metal transporter [Bacteroidales bacterium]|jgi:ZIP family zinc transporter|nr:ZIP family metal transporter [Bacteroidales bacterium]